MIKTLRPSVLPDNKKLVIYPLVVCLVIAGVGIIIGNLIVVVLPLIVLAVFPGLPIFFHLLMHIFVKIELYPQKIVVKDYLGNNIVRPGWLQEMAYADISYIYYLSKEINLQLVPFSVEGSMTTPKLNLMRLFLSWQHLLSHPGPLTRLPTSIFAGNP